MNPRTLAAVLPAVLLTLLPCAPALAQQAASPAAAGMKAAGHANAGFGNEAFFLRSSDDNFILIPSGRFQFDFFGYQGGARQPFNTFLPKRVRIETLGTVMKHWDFQLGSEFTGSAPTLTDAWLNANYVQYANVQLGQFDAPFTLDNRTSDKWSDMQERTNAVRDLAIPENKEIGGMVWGQPERKWAYWSAGVFNGEGMDRFTHGSNSFDAMGRAWFAPLGLAGNERLKDVWVGGSYWNGFRKSSFANQIDRPAMKDQASFTFFNPVYGTVHAGDQGQLTKWGLELNAPIGPVVVKAEYVNASEGIRELDLAVPAKPSFVRTARLTGNSYYGRVSYFVWGDPLINGLGGMQNPPHLFGPLKPGKTETALQLVAQYDHISFTYAADDGASASQDKLVGDYGVNVVGLGANYWYTKHVRLTGDALYNTFTGASHAPLISSNHSYELTFRVALAL